MMASLTRYSKGYKIRDRIHFPDGTDRLAFAYRRVNHDAEAVLGQVSQLESITRQNALTKEYWGNLVTNIALAEKYLDCVGQMIQELHRLTNGKTDATRVLQGGRYISKTVFIAPARPMGA
jgi:hypothetical protein